MILKIIDKKNQSHGYLNIPEDLLLIDDVYFGIEKIKREIKEEYFLEDNEFDIYDYWDEFTEALAEELNVYYYPDYGNIQI